jgi:hypothetical protein
MTDEFSIRFREPSYPLQRGELVFGEERELFDAELSYWTRAQYESHWRTALESTRRSDRTALITSLSDPATANFIRWWPAYLRGRTVLFQEQILFLADLKVPFDPRHPERFVGERAAASADGTPLSEWEVGVEAIERFLGAAL